MPIKKEREYRALAAPLTAQSATKLIQTEYYVEGYATTFDTPYLLYEFEDGTKIYERIDAHALDGADMSDVSCSTTMRAGYLPDSQIRH